MPDLPGVVVLSDNEGFFCIKGAVNYQTNNIVLPLLY